ncbi:MAG: MBL fold metallo-hydrolase [Lachnospiraceae bacterium]|nr:MBL fold metallo-hydrolase [Lachnospiraceae bacterium]
MKIHYIKHSGFFLEWDNCGMLFDYWKGQLPETALNRELFVFASHAHEDHFNPIIFEWSLQHPNVHYVLSGDIQKKVKRMHIGEIPSDRITYLRPGEELFLQDQQKNPISVRTLRSTDCGVAFLVRYMGKNYFHAGDLNCWTWPDDTKQHRNQMIAEYQREIDKLQGQRIAAAFLPLDPRMRTEYDRGIRYFLSRVEAEQIYPMHIWEKYSTVEKFRSGLPEEEREKIMEIRAPGMIFEEEETGV